MKEMLKELPGEAVDEITQWFQRRAFSWVGCASQSPWKIAKLVFLRRRDASAGKGIRGALLVGDGEVVLVSGTRQWYQDLPFEAALHTWLTSLKHFRLVEGTEGVGEGGLHVGARTASELCHTFRFW